METKITLRDINKALKAEFGDLRLVHGRDYWYFSGEATMGWRRTSIYQYSRPSIEEALKEAREMKAEGR